MSKLNNKNNKVRPNDTNFVSLSFGLNKYLSSVQKKFLKINQTLFEVNVKYKVAIPLNSFWFVNVKIKYFNPTFLSKDIYLLLLVSKIFGLKNIFLIRWSNKGNSKIEKYVLYNLFFGGLYLVLLNLSKTNSVTLKYLLF